MLISLIAFAKGFIAFDKAPNIMGSVILNGISAPGFHRHLFKCFKPFQDDVPAWNALPGDLTMFS